MSQIIGSLHLTYPHLLLRVMNPERALIPSIGVNKSVNATNNNPAPNSIPRVDGMTSPPYLKNRHSEKGNSTPAAQRKISIAPRPTPARKVFMPVSFQ